MTGYSPEELFTNAKFAKHFTGRTATREGKYEWRTSDGGLISQTLMPQYGWTPVLTPKALTEAEFDAEFGPQWRWNVVDIKKKLINLGIEIETTNADRLAEAIDIASRGVVLLRPDEIKHLAEALDDDGVMAGEINGE